MRPQADSLGSTGAKPPEKSWAQPRCKCGVVGVGSRLWSGPTGRRRSLEVRAASRAAARLRREVVVPSVSLAEALSRPRHNSLVDACLSRETGIQVRDRDRPLARIVGGVLASARARSEHLADTHVIAAAVELGGGLALTADAGDLRRLATSYENVTVIGLA